jgi:hypothetical protein
VKPMISALLGSISEHVSGILDSLEGLLGMLPAGAAGPVQMAFDLITQTLDGVFGMVQGILDSVLGGESAGFGGIFDSLCGLIGNLPIVGDFLPICRS